MTNLDSTASVPIAIIGIGCLFPEADSVESYWANLKNGVDAISDVPPTHWRPEDYFDADPKKPDHTYATRGGFLSPVDFPALDFGIAPNVLEATDTTQLLGLSPPSRRSTRPVTAAGRELRPQPGQRHPGRDRNAGTGHSAGGPARPSAVEAGPQGSRRRRCGGRRGRAARSPIPTSAGRKIRFPGCWATSSRAGSPIGSIWAAPTASSMPPVPVR